MKLRTQNLTKTFKGGFTLGLSIMNSALERLTLFLATMGQVNLPFFSC